MATMIRSKTTMHWIGGQWLDSGEHGKGINPATGEVIGSVDGVRRAAEVDVDRPLRVARALQAGTIWINHWASIHDEFEEGAFKQSGRGRLRGQAGLDDFLECKHIALKPGTLRR
jgi:acyl-CoA reductase-like NAD-dependent aldehyde dehydrogenase